MHARALVPAERVFKGQEDRPELSLDHSGVEEAL